MFELSVEWYIEAQATTVSKALFVWNFQWNKKSNETKRNGTAKLDWHRNICVFATKSLNKKRNIFHYGKWSKRDNLELFWKNVQKSEEANAKSDSIKYVWKDYVCKSRPAFISNDLLKHLIANFPISEQCLQP